MLKASARLRGQAEGLSTRTGGVDGRFLDSRVACEDQPGFSRKSESIGYRKLCKRDLSWKLVLKVLPVRKLQDPLFETWRSIKKGDSIQSEFKHLETERTGCNTQCFLTDENNGTSPGFQNPKN